MCQAIRFGTYPCVCESFRSFFLSFFLSLGLSGDFIPAGGLVLVVVSFRYTSAEALLCAEMSALIYDATPAVGETLSFRSGSTHIIVCVPVFELCVCDAWMVDCGL
jgi:hypothetical protein